MESTSREQEMDKADNPEEGNQELQPRIEELRGRLESLNQRVKGYIQERPVVCLAGAVALGYLVARISRRRS